MSSVSSERMDATTAAIEEALGRIGERISEGEATAEVCKCKEGMFAQPRGVSFSAAPDLSPPSE